MSQEDSDDAQQPLRVGDIMTNQVICLKPEMTLESVTELFLERRISGAPVIDDDGRAVGIISKTDLIRESHDRENLTEWEVADSEDEGDRGFHIQNETRATVAEVMTPVVVTLAEDALITEAAQIMIEKRIHRIPVVSESGRVGIVSAVDLLGPMATRTPSDRTA